MSDANVNTQLSAVEIDIAKLENSRRNWRTAGLVFGSLSLANVPLTMLTLQNTDFFGNSLGGSVQLAILSYTVFSSIPFLLIAFVCMGIALSRKSSAASIRRLQQIS